MELRDVTVSVRRYRVLNLLLVVIGGVAAFVLAAIRPAMYETSLSIAVNRTNKQATLDYEFDGYYAIQAADLVSQTVVSWFSTPAVVVEVYNRAGIDPRVESLESLSGRFRTRKYSAQNIVVRFSAPAREEAQQLADAIGAVTSERGETLNQSADAKALFAVDTSEAVIVLTESNRTLSALVGLVAGALVAVFVTSALVYFRGDPADAHRD